MKSQKAVCSKLKSEVKRFVTLRSLLVTLLLVTCHLSPVTVSEAKVYIDITSPAIRKIPISMTTKGPSEAKEIESIVMNDLGFTGLFAPVAPEIPGAEIVVQAEVNASYNETSVLWSLTDLIENQEVLKKRNTAPKKSIRAIAHAISNDIYMYVTEKEGCFRTKISYLVYTSPGNKELRLMDWDGYNSIKVIPIGLTSSHAWSNDGRYLMYSSERNRAWKVYLFDLNDFKETVLFSSRGLNLVGNASPQDKIAFSSSRDGNSEIFTINKDGTNLRKLTNSFGIDVSPVFSPDGASIAFVSDRGGSPQIYLMDSDGSGIRRITFEGSYNTSPSWSPDGRWLAYVGMKDGKNQIFMIKSDATELRQLTFNGNNEGPSFSPDGLFLAFDSDRDGKRGVYIMRSNGAEQKRITPTDTKAMAPKWSPYFK
jgi:TolB protein